MNPKKVAAAKTPTTSASLTFISLSFSYNAERARANAADLETIQYFNNMYFKHQVVDRVK